MGSAGRGSAGRSAGIVESATIVGIIRVVVMWKRSRRL